MLEDLLPDVYSDENSLDGSGELLVFGIKIVPPLVLDGGGAGLVTGVATKLAAPVLDGGGSSLLVGARSELINEPGIAGGGDVVATAAHIAAAAAGSGEGGGALLETGAKSEIVDQPAVGGGGGLEAAAIHVVTLQSALDAGGSETAVSARGARSAQALDGGGDPINSATSNRGSETSDAGGGGGALAVGGHVVQAASGSGGGGASSTLGQRSLVGEIGHDGGGEPLAVGFLTFAPTIGPAEGGGDLVMMGVRNSGCDALSLVRIAPDAITGISNLSGDIFDINDDPDSDDGDWLIAPDPLTNTFVETSFFTPPAPTHGPQRMLVRVRTTFLAPEVTANIPLLPPTVRLDVVDNGGTLLATSGDMAVPTDYPHGGEVLVDFDAAQFIVADGSMIQLKVFGTAALFEDVGWTVEVGGIAWLVGRGCVGMSMNGGGDNRSAGNRHACFAFVDMYSDTYSDTYGQTFSPCGPSMIDIGGTPLAVARKESAAIQMFAGGGSNEAQPQIRRQIVTITVDGGGADTAVGQRTITIGPFAGGGAPTAGLLKGGRGAAAWPGGGASSAVGLAAKRLPCIITGWLDSYELTGSVEGAMLTGTVETYALIGVVGNCGHTGDCDCGC